MTNFDIIRSAWSEENEKAKKSPWMQRVAAGNVDLRHYIGFLLETYHNAGMNPQLQAFATMFFKEKHREVVKKFYRHAISEIGHDLLAMNDLAELGVGKNTVEKSKPLPTTSAFFGHFFYKIQTDNPLHYLGYLFHLEFSPTQDGPKYIQMLKAKGIPESALTFLHEHATVDIAHNKLMESYINELVKTSEDLDVVIESVKCAVQLHTIMLSHALENGEILAANAAA